MKLGRILIAACICLSMSACSKSSSKREKTKEVDTEEIMASASLTPAQKSEKLALAAEQLVSPTSFMYADVVAEQALSVDKTNVRAKYVKAMVAPMMSLRGIMARIQPIATRNAESKAQYDETMAKLDKAPRHALRDFLLDGQPSIKTEADVQKAFDYFRAGFSAQRKFFKANKNTEMTLNLPDFVVAKGTESEDEDACHWEKAERGHYVKYCEDGKDEVILQYKANRADFEALQQMVAGFEIYMVLYNSYSYSGAMDVAEKYKGSTSSDSAEIRKALLANKEFGTLRGAAINSIVTMGLDAVGGIRYAKALKKELCPKGYDAPKSRPGYVFENGICIQENASKTAPLDDILATIELVFKGGLYKTTFGGSNGTLTTEIRPVSFFEGSVADVRDLGLSFNKCGRVTSAADSTLGGIFVKKDVNAAFALSNHECD